MTRLRTGTVALRETEWPEHGRARSARLANRATPPVSGTAPGPRAASRANQIRRGDRAAGLLGRVGRDRPARRHPGPVGRQPSEVVVGGVVLLHEDHHPRHRTHRRPPARNGGGESTSRGLEARDRLTPRRSSTTANRARIHPRRNPPERTALRGALSAPLRARRSGVWAGAPGVPSGQRRGRAKGGFGVASHRGIAAQGSSCGP
jgi:hypothetical protein